jgi:hypothetical protein
MSNTKYIRIFSVIVLISGVFLFADFGNNQNNSPQIGYTAQGRDHISVPGPQSLDGNKGFPETVAEIMERQRSMPPLENIINDAEEKERNPDRRNLPQNPESKEESSYPPLTADQKNHQNHTQETPQTIGTSFTGVQVSESGFIPADNMGAVGPTQYIAIANGRIKTFTKSTGVADGVLNATTDVFFASVNNGDGTSDPRIRYDRMTQRWFAVMISVPNGVNRILIAVSSESTISLSTIWTFYFITAQAGQFIDYPTLGIDNNALYIGTNNFNPPSFSFAGTRGYVINKASLLLGTATATLFTLAPNGSTAGPYTPQGVDNLDPAATEGYFIGVDMLVFGKLVMRRVSNPGGSPTISGNLDITVNTTTFPIAVPANLSTRPLDALDDRLFGACIRNGRLWTAHNIQVDASGVGSTTGGRNGSRWYELTNLTTVPTVFQSGTIFDPAAANPHSFWIPAVMVSGQGHAAFIFSRSGALVKVNTATTGRLSGDALGTTQLNTNITSSLFNYNIQLSGTQRWGDYTNMSLDPDDNMTMWGVAGYCNATNSWGMRVTKLLAPLPPPLTSATPPSLNPGQPSVNVVIIGTPVNGEGFYDPGAGYNNRISATISGGVTVNSTTYNSPTQVTLNVSTIGASVGSKTLTVINPDGQSVSSAVIFSVPLPVLLSSFTSTVDKRNVILKWTTLEEINNRGFDIERQSVNNKGDLSEWVKIGFIDGYGNSQETHDYIYNDNKLATGKYNFRLKQIDYNGNFERFNLPSSVVVGIPVTAELSQNYPNPFNPVTKIDYAIKTDGNVSIIVYDIIGREVTRLVDEIKTAGYYSAEFNASSLSSGVYFYKITSPEFSQVKKMLIVK